LTHGVDLYSAAIVKEALGKECHAVLFLVITVGCEKPVPLFHRCSFLEQVDEETEGTD